jgi:hypothetical protein
MEPMTVVTTIIFADPEMLDIAYRGRDILRALNLCHFYRSSAIAEMVNLPKPVTRKLLKELVKVGLVFTDPWSDPDRRILYGTLPTEEDIRSYGAQYVVKIVPASKIYRGLPKNESY